MDHAQRSSNVQSTRVRESCSIQSHMSTANSQQRLRTTPAGSTMVSEKRDRLLDEVQPVVTVAADPINKILLKMGLLTTPILPGAHYNRQTSARAWSTLLVKWIAAVYCLLSCAVMTIDCYKYLSVSLGKCTSLFGMFNVTRTSTASDSVPEHATDINNLSLRHRLLRVTSSHNVLDMEPYLLGQSVANEDDITACLWVTDVEDLKPLVAWSRTWPG